MRFIAIQVLIIERNRGGEEIALYPGTRMYEVVSAMHTQYQILYIHMQYRVHQIYMINKTPTL